MPEGPSRTYLPARTKSFMGEGAWGGTWPMAAGKGGGAARRACSARAGQLRRSEAQPRARAAAAGSGGGARRGGESVTRGGRQGWRSGAERRSKPA